MFHGMKLYTIHIKPGSDITLDKPVFLREGFNWWAFLFTFLWALYKKLWLFGIAIFLANVAIMLVIETGIIGEYAGAAMQFAVQIFVGFSANDALRKRMQKDGYIFQDITSGDSLLRAEQRYFDRLVMRTA